MLEVISNIIIQITSIFIQTLTSVINLLTLCIKKLKLFYHWVTGESYLDKSNG